MSNPYPIKFVPLGTTYSGTVQTFGSGIVVPYGGILSLILTLQSKNGSPILACLLQGRNDDSETWRNITNYTFANISATGGEAKTFAGAHSRMRLAYSIGTGSVKFGVEGRIQE